VIELETNCLLRKTSQSHFVLCRIKLFLNFLTLSIVGGEGRCFREHFSDGLGFPEALQLLFSRLLWFLEINSKMFTPAVKVDKKFAPILAHISPGSQSCWEFPAGYQWWFRCT